MTLLQFRALVTPCMPKCEPVQCDILDYTGQTKTVDSYGKRKRRSMSKNPTNLMSLLTHTSNVRQRRNTEPEEVLVVQTLRIVDRYGKRKELPKAQVNTLSVLAMILVINVFNRQYSFIFGLLILPLVILIKFSFLECRLDIEFL